jgi:hypothetical protein
MKTKLSALLIALALCVVALPAQAQFTWLDDPALTPGDDTDRIVFSEAAVAAGGTSIEFVTPGATYMHYSYTTSNCATCNHQVQIQAQRPNGTWYLWDAPSAETTNVTEDYVLTRAANSGGNASNITVWQVKPVPPKWRVNVTRSGGTGTVDVLVQVVVW